MDEEKTIDEAVDEQADEMKEFEPVAFDEVIKDEPVKESAPVLRALGDPEPADMNMIHKHVDNFLAKIAGETPIDDNVRDSTEYWLKRIAGLAGNISNTPHITKIWENENPAIPMFANTVPMDLSAYNYFMVIFKTSAGSTGYNMMSVPKGNPSAIYTFSANVVARRGIQFSNSEIVFDNGFNSNWSSVTTGLEENSVACVPVTIYGVSFT